MTGAPAATGSAPLLALKAVSIQFGTFTAVHPLNLEVKHRDFVAILGPSGCGKTTLLRMIGGFVSPTSGTVEIDGRDVTQLGPEARPTNTVFQGYGLFPHMTVRQNVGYGLRLRKTPRNEIDDRVADALRLSRLTDFADRHPALLSGGQQQRVALARALIMRPKVLLLDEPLAALDLKLRHAMQDELHRLHDDFGGTFLFVTHDQSEALGLANRIAVMNAGRLEQEGDAETIYSAPSTRFVATFIGDANVLEGIRSDGKVRLAAGPEFEHREGGAASGQVSVIVRPQAVRFIGPDAKADIVLSGSVSEIVYLGDHIKCRVTTEGGHSVLMHLDPEIGLRPSPGDKVSLGWDLARMRVVDH